VQSEPPARVRRGRVDAHLAQGQFATVAVLQVEATYQQGEDRDERPLLDPVGVVRDPRQPHGHQDEDQADQQAAAHRTRYAAEPGQGQSDEGQQHDRIAGIEDRVAHRGHHRGAQPRGHAGDRKRRERDPRGVDAAEHGCLPVLGGSPGGQAEPTTAEQQAHRDTEHEAGADRDLRLREVEDPGGDEDDVATVA
jgi:hypothetical protein